MNKIRFGKLLIDFECIENLDNKISKTEILKEYFKKKKAQLLYAIEKLKFMSGRKKVALDVHLKDLKLQIA